MGKQASYLIRGILDLLEVPLEVVLAFSLFFLLPPSLVLAPYICEVANSVFISARVNVLALRGA